MVIPRMSTRGLGELGGHQSVDDANGRIFVSVNDGAQDASLWPAFTDVPVGWWMGYDKAARAASLQ